MSQAAAAAPARAGSALEVRVATTADLRALRRFGEQPMAGRVRLSKSESPRLGSQNERTVIFSLPESERVVAAGRRSVWPVVWQGQRARIGYLSGLQAESPYLGRRRLARAFELLAESRGPDQEGFDLTAIVADNAPARRLLERGLPGVPTYRPWMELETLVVSTRGARRTSQLTVQAATRDDRLELTSFWNRRFEGYELAPAWRLDDGEAGSDVPGLRIEDAMIARESGRIVAAGAVWDRRAERQLRIHGYSAWLAALRPLLNLGLGATGRPRLPPPGSRLELGYVAGFAVGDDEPERALALLDGLRAKARARGLRQLVLTLPRAHSLRAELARRSGARPYPSILYTVTWPGAVPPPAAASAQAIQVEAGLL